MSPLASCVLHLDRLVPFQKKPCPLRTQESHWARLLHLAVAAPKPHGSPDSPPYTGPDLAERDGSRNGGPDLPEANSRMSYAAFRLGFEGGRDGALRGTTFISRSRTASC